MKRSWIGILAIALLALARPPSAPAVHASGPLPGVTVGNDQLSFSVQGGLGMAQGESREVVYDVDELGREFKLSELIWDIDSVVMAGGTLSVQIGPRYRVSASYWAAITEGSGQMDDYDWLYGPDYPWTDYSLSDVEVRDTYAFDLNVAMELFREGSVAVSGVLGYRQDRWGWDDALVRYLYTDMDFRDSYGEGDGEAAISYEQEFRIPYIGVSAILTGRTMSAEAYFHYSPMVTAEDHDYHILRDTTFDVEADGGDYFGFGARLGYALTPALSAQVGAEWQVIPEMRGDTTINAPDGSGEISDSGGIENQWMLLSLSMGYTF